MSIPAFPPFDVKDALIRKYEKALQDARDKLLAFIMREYGSGGEPDEGTLDHPLEAVCQMMSEALAQADTAKEEKGK